MLFTHNYVNDSVSWIINLGSADTPFLLFYFHFSFLNAVFRVVICRYPYMLVIHYNKKKNLTSDFLVGLVKFYCNGALFGKFR